MEIAALLGAPVAQGQATNATEQGKGSAAAAFAALIDWLQAPVADEGEPPSEVGEDEREEAADSDDQVVLAVVPEPALPVPVAIAPASEAVESVESVKAVEEGLTKSPVALDGIVRVAPAPPSVPEAIAMVAPSVAPDKVPTADAAAESAIADNLSSAPGAAAREVPPKPAMPVPHSDSSQARNLAALPTKTAERQEDAAATQASDKPETPAAFDLPELAAITVSVSEGKALAAPPELHGGMRPHAPAEARHVLRQLGDKLSEGAEGVVEIALSPEELGKVRLVIAPGDKPAVTVFADRPETYDLLRRNADALDKELRSAGIFGADISFSGGNDGRDRGNTATPEMRGSGQRQPTPTFAEHSAPARPRPIADRRIDIRI